MTIDETRRIGDDLEYVRGVVDGARPGAAPGSILYLWAAISLVGFSLADLAPERIGLFWLIAAPAGFVASMALGWRGARAAGVESRRQATAHMLHWGGMLAAILLLVPLVAAGHLSGPGMGQAVLVVVALGYFLAGVHLARPFLWVAPLVAVGYGLTFALDDWAWTIAGVIVALGLVVTARVAGRG